MNRLSLYEVLFVGGFVLLMAGMIIGIFTMHSGRPWTIVSTALVVAGVVSMGLGVLYDILRSGKAIRTARSEQVDESSSHDVR